MNPDSGDIGDVYQHLAARAIEWARRLADHEASTEDVVEEITGSVTRSPHLLWEFTVVAVACVRETMEGIVIGSVSTLHVVTGTSWTIRKAPNDPDVLAMIQAATAMANNDFAMARDVLIAHRRAGGPRALLGVATCAIGMLANLLGHEMTEAPDDDWRF